MKKLKFKINVRKNDFIFIEKGKDFIVPICKGKRIPLTRRAIIENTLQLNKALDYNVTLNTKQVAVTVFQDLTEFRYLENNEVEDFDNNTVFQNHTKVYKVFNADINDTDLTNIKYFKRTVKKLEGFILEIEDYFKNLEENAKEETFEFTIGGN